MNPIATQQAAFDNALVPPKKRLKIERCNARIEFSKPQEKKHIKSPWMLSSYLLTIPHFRLLLKSWKSTCINFGLPSRRSEIQMHTNSSWKRRSSELIQKSFVKFFKYVPEFSTKILLHRLQKKNLLHSFGNLAILASAFLGKQQDLIDSGNHELKSCGFVSKADDTQKYGALIPDEMINQNIKDSKAYKTYYDFDTGKVEPKKARKFNKVASLSRKLPPVKEAKPVKKAKRVKRPAKKSTTTPTTSFVIIDTPGVSVSKKKAPAKADRSKGIEILSDLALSEATQLKEATKRSMKDFHISQASGSGDGTDFESGVPDEQQHKTSGTYKGTDDNDDENPSFTLKDYDEEEYDKEYEFDDDYENVYEEEDDDLYKDVDVRSLGAKHDKERKAVDEVASMMNVKSCQEESRTQAPSLFTIPKTAISKTATTHATTVPPTISMITPLPQLTTPSPAPTTVLTTTSIPALPDFSSLFGFDQRVSILETELS
ncbi:hypothetical protein Tco_0373664 [Tanacetum coccineum]